MNNVPEAPTPSPSRPIKKRIAIPITLIVIVVLLLTWGAIRGTWADAEVRTPSSAADGVMAQLLRTANGRKQLRAALIVSVPPDRVWNVVTNYDHFTEVFPNISASKGTREPDGRWHLTGEVRSIIWRWPMDVHLRHLEEAGRFIASWDEPHGTWKVNRGSWVVTPHGAGETLLEYNLDLKVAPFPDFVVRAVLFGQLKPIIKAVASHAQRDQSRR
jgi:hypothetical protein